MVLKMEAIKDPKNILIIGLVIALAGSGFYFFHQTKANKEEVQKLATNFNELRQALMSHNKNFGEIQKKFDSHKLTEKNLRLDTEEALDKQSEFNLYFSDCINSTVKALGEKEIKVASREAPRLDLGFGKKKKVARSKYDSDDEQTETRRRTPPKPRQEERRRTPPKPRQERRRDYESDDDVEAELANYRRK